MKTLFAVYAKCVIAGSAALAVAGSALSDGHITASEWVAIAAAALGTLGVGLVPNKEG